MESRKNVDVLIIGGGLVGGTLGLLLKDSNYSVAVVDENDPDILLNSLDDGRSYAISLGSKRILDKTPVWQNLNEQFNPIEKIYVSSDINGPFLEYDYQDIATEPLGYLVDATLLRKTVLKICMESKVEWLGKTKPTAVNQTGSGIIVSLDRGQEIQAKLLVVADGKFSPTRNMLGISTKSLDYNQEALVFNVSHLESHENKAFEIFTTDGPFAMLPMQNNKSACVWSVSTKISRVLKGLENKTFEEELNHRFANLLGELKLDSQIRAFPLKICQATRFIGEHFVIIGDAAHSMHPVAGQGLNLGFRDAQALGEILNKLSNLGIDPYHLDSLKVYERKRFVDNLSLLAVTHGSVRGLSIKSPVARKLIDCGFQVLDKVGPLKKFMMKRAMGI